MHLLSRWTLGLLIASGAAFGIAALAGLNAWSSYNSWTDGFGSLREAAAATDTLGVAIFIANLTMLPTGIVMIVWMYRYSGQLRSSNPNAAHRWSRGWTIGAWFIPIGNLWIPKQIIDDFWRCSTDRGDLPQQNPPLLDWWWATWLAGSILLQIAGAGDLRQTVGWHTFYMTAVIGAGLVAASGALAAALVSNLAERLGALGPVRGHGGDTRSSSLGP